MIESRLFTTICGDVKYIVKSRQSILPMCMKTNKIMIHDRTRSVTMI